MGFQDYNDQSDAGGAGDELAGVLSPMSPQATAAAKARRNNIVLAALVLVGVAVGVKQFIGGGAKPAAAATSVVSPSGASIAPGTHAKTSAVEQFLAGGAGDLKAARELMRHTEQIVETFK